MNRRQAERVAWTIAAAGLIGTIIAWIIAPAAFPHAWLAALSAWLGWPLGCMGLLLVHALTGGRWGYALRLQLVAGMHTLVLLLPALIPWLLVMPALYPWARPEAPAHLANGFYLNLPFFAARGGVYLLIWFGLRFFILRALREDEPDAALARIAPGGLILLAMTISFAAIDTTMSLDPQFNSSVYGLMAMVGMGLLALSVSLLAAAVGSPPDPETTATLGKLLLALVLLWAYLDFMQFLIVWQSDLATEAPWYLLRSCGGWGIAAALVALGHFLLPFLALIWTPVRRSPGGIGSVAALLVLTEVIRTWWLVIPASHSGFGLIDLMAMMGLLAVGAAFALRSPLSPQVRPPLLPASSAAAREQHG
ncbi:MAG: hypothetical protein JWN85_1295 [Gammaproteobacteria bacterium]|nr:hypothetical protein [Gammaproteobacteria bacterium]